MFLQDKSGKVRKEGNDLGEELEKFICYNEKQEYEGLTMPSENIDEEDLFLSK